MIRTKNKGFFTLEIISVAIIVSISLSSIVLCYLCGLNTMNRHSARNNALRLAHLELMNIINKKSFPKCKQWEEEGFIIKSGAVNVRGEIPYKQVYVYVYLKGETQPIVNLVIYE